MLIEVESSDLKKVFSDISSLSCEVISFTTENNDLIITAGTSVVYETVIHIVQSLNYMDTVMNVQYLNMEELLGEKGNVKLEFTQFSIDMEYRTMSISLSASDSIVQRPDADTAEKVLIPDRDSLTSALSVFKGLGIFQKTLQMDRPLQLFGDYGVVQFPTVWVRVRSSGITNVITKEQAIIISAFEPEEYSIGETLSLYKGNARLMLPLSPVPEDDEFLQLVDTMTSLGAKTTKGLLARTKRLSRTLGVCDCSVYVGESTLHFAITKNTLHIVDKADDTIQYSFDTRLEYITAILGLIGSDNALEVLTGKDIVCLRNARVSVILSTGR